MLRNYNTYHKGMLFQECMGHNTDLDLCMLRRLLFLLCWCGGGNGDIPDMSFVGIRNSADIDLHSRNAAVAAGSWLLLVWGAEGLDQMLYKCQFKICLF